MAWVRLDDQLPHHRKFLKAGAAASWLWVCGVAYAQRQLTDGIIPREAVPTLGVPNPRKLIDKLVAVGLWDVHELGWKVHDYLEHNECRDAVLSRRSEMSSVRSIAGRRGGEASGRARRSTPEANAKQTGSKEEANQKQVLEANTKPVPISVPVPITVPNPKKELIHGDVAFVTFRDAYPEARRKGGYMAQTAFIDALTAAGGPQALMEALENHKASEQWQNPKLIPGMDTWLSEERWRQRFAPSHGGGTSSKTAGNAAALQRFANRGVQ